MKFSFILFHKIPKYFHTHQYYNYLSIAHIPSPNLAPIPSIDSNITGSDILANWHYHYELANGILPTDFWPNDVVPFLKETAAM